MSKGKVVSIANYGVVLEAVSAKDLEMIRQWRNHPEVAAYMFSQDAISVEQQQQWFERIQHDPRQQHFVIRYKGEAIGVINGKSLDEKVMAEAATIEVGMYIAPESRYRGTVLAFCPALAFSHYCFRELACQSLQAEVIPGNTAALRFNQQLGYTEYARNDEKVTLQLTPENFQAACEKLSPVIRF